ncbi:MAG: phage holin family protein [Coriobacteriales bacterium]|nr:phage holin family protein [Coriobacteriales bacterium]
MPEDPTPTSPFDPPDPPPEPGKTPPERTPLIDAVSDLAQSAVDYARTQAEDLMRDKIALPLQKLGLTLASGTAAGCLFVLGIGFISVGLLIGLAQLITWVGALCLIGAILCIGAGIFTYIKVRSMQHELPADAKAQGKPLAPADAPGTPPSVPRGAQEEG